MSKLGKAFKKYIYYIFYNILCNNIALCFSITAKQMQITEQLKDDSKIEILSCTYLLQLA